MHTLPPAAQAAIRDDLEGTHKYATHDIGDDATARHRFDDDDPTASKPI
jgi:phospholipid/cholesterol/gamma-HCH transport system ATP-binding protein